VAEAPSSESVYEVECPHCRKQFKAVLLDGAAARYQGFKCPHCKLFVPFKRAEEQELVEKLD
jgi:phage FluMu protein Com